MVTQQVVLLSHTSEQVDPSTTLPPPPPQPAPPTGGVHGVGALRAQRVEAVKGSPLDRCGYPLSGLPREPPGVHVPLQLHHRRLGQHSPVHSSAVVGDPWRPDSHQPTPARPPPFLKREAIQVWCPLGPLVYAGCSAAASAASTGGRYPGQGSTLCALVPLHLPGVRPRPWEPDPACEAAPPVPKAVKE